MASNSSDERKKADVDRERRSLPAMASRHVQTLFGSPRVAMRRRVSEQPAPARRVSARRVSLGEEEFDTAVRRSMARRRSDAAPAVRSNRSFSLRALPVRRKRSSASRSLSPGRRDTSAGADQSSSAPSSLLTSSSPRLAAAAAAIAHSSSSTSSSAPADINAGLADSSDSSTTQVSRVCKSPALYVCLPDGHFLITASKMTQTLMPMLRAAASVNNDNDNDDNNNNAPSSLKALWFSDSVRQRRARHNRMRALVVIDANHALRDYAPLVDTANRHSLLRLTFVSAERLGNEWDARLVARCIGNASRWLIDTPEITAFCQYAYSVVFFG
jgi:hypothetical protein